MEQIEKTQPVEDETEIDRIINKGMASHLVKKYVFTGEEKTTISEVYWKNEDTINNFEVRDNDVFVFSYPKSGTTWAQEMVWMICNNMDFERAKVSLNVRFPYLEYSAFLDMENLNNSQNTDLPEDMVNSMEFVRNLKSPRFIKSHLPFSLLPLDIRNNHKTPKMIYVMRNPKDVCISYYHHSVLLDNFRISLEDFCKVFLADKVIYSPYWKHIFGFWSRRHAPNLLIITYEEMKQDICLVVRKVAAFLDKTLTDKQVKQLGAHLSFASMKKNEAVNFERHVEFLKMNNLSEGKGTFMRSGVVGKYREELSPDLINKFDEWIRQNVENTGFSEAYPYMV